MKPTLLLWLLACLFASFIAQAAQQRPNVLLICVDDLKPVLGCYGDPIAKSPNIDRLASRGVLFTHAYANQAVCAPSRNALMTGLRPTTLGIYDLATNFRKAAPDAVTLAQYFKQQGWRTEALGKIFHVGHGNGEDPASWTLPHWSPRGGPRGGYFLPEHRPKLSVAQKTATTDTAKGAPVECADVPDNTYGDGLIAEEAIRRLAQAKASSQTPFFLAVGFLKPHLPFVAPKKYWDLYKRDQFQLPALQKPPEGGSPFGPTSWGELRAYSDIPATGPLTKDKALELIHGYHAALSYMDAQLGKVLNELENTGLATNTIVILWGDHGWHLGDHGLWCKHTNYEQATRIPLIISVPGGPKGAKTGALVETVDLYPTLCELGGLPPKSGLDGVSFARALKSPATATTKPAVFHCYPRSPRGAGEFIGRAVRTETHRLVEWKKPGAPPETASIELYDYVKDPEETRNHAQEQPEKVAQLRALLKSLPEAKPQLKVASDPNAPAKKAPVDRVALFNRRDKDNNGRLTMAEFMDGQPDPDEAPKRFTRFDIDKDGELSRDEFVSGGSPRPK